ncbi:helix-turn-helix domain-containing protein [Streptomyces sp. NPDC014894]|uniref:AraC-like ligand-binding domain-containing protein n=1 Tax=Streptomyces sp. NPDC014894 TaxID=3364931 RepID=UPI003702E733
MSSEAVPARDRTEWYQDVIAQEVAPTRLMLADTDSFRAEAAVLELGRVRVSRFSYTSLLSWRTPELIRRSDPERYSLAFMTQSTMWISQRRSHAELFAGDAVLFDSSHPFDAGTGSMAGGPDGALVRVVIVSLPRDAVSLPPDRVDRLLARRLDGRTGMGAILGQFVTALETHAGDCLPHELEQLADTTLALSSAFLASRLDSYGDLPAETRARALLERINSFIDHNLGDPALTPRAVAERHHISLRSLYLLFQGQGGGESVAASIRRRRLERCRADLVRPELLAAPIHSVAARWGFNSAAVFGRAFREVYGASPREYRRQAVLTGAAGAVAGGGAGTQLRALHGTSKGVAS